MHCPDPWFLCLPKRKIIMDYIERYFLFGFWGPPLAVTPRCTYRNHSWWCFGDRLGCSGSNMDQLHARQAPYRLCYLFSIFMKVQSKFLFVKGEKDRYSLYGVGSPREEHFQLLFSLPFFPCSQTSHLPYFLQIPICEQRLL